MKRLCVKFERKIYYSNLTSCQNFHAPPQANIRVSAKENNFIIIHTGSTEINSCCYCIYRDMPRCICVFGLDRCQRYWLRGRIQVDSSEQAGDPAFLGCTSAKWYSLPFNGGRLRSYDPRRLLGRCQLCRRKQFYLWEIENKFYWQEFDSTNQLFVIGILPVLKYSSTHEIHVNSV